MSEGIIIALISGGFALVGYVIGAYLAQSKTLYRIEQLEKKQDKHNSLIERMYAIEDKYNVLDEKMKVANHRIDDIENNISA